MALQKLILWMMLRLPRRVLLAMSGGQAIEIDGRVMDPAVQFLAAQGAKAPPMESLPPDAARQAAAAAFALLNPARRRGVEIKEEAIPSPDPSSGGVLPVRHYRPAGRGGALPALVWFHMGGWVIGDLNTNDYFCSLLARQGLHIMSVDYRLAPEHKFPAAMEDGIAAYQWLAGAGGEGLADKSRIGVGGDSAGGGIAAMICQQAKQRGLAQPRLQLLVYPAVDLTAAGGSMVSCAPCYPLTADLMKWFRGHWLNRPDEADMVMASPALAEDLAGLAPAIVITAGFDVLRDQGIAYGRRLEAAGVDVVARTYDALAHAFIGQTLIPAAMKAARETAALTAKAL